MRMGARSYSGTPEARYGKGDATRRMGGYEEFFSLSPRQERVFKWIQSVGQKRAIEQMRDKHGEAEVHD